MAIENQLPAGMLDLLNDRIETDTPNVPVSEGNELPQLDQSAPDPPPADLTPLADREAAAKKPAYLEEIEESIAGEGEPGEDGEHIPGGFDAEEIEGVGELVAGIVGQGKEALNKFFAWEFRKKVQKHFRPEELELVKLAAFLDRQGHMSSDNAEVMEKWAKQYNTKLPTLIAVYVDYMEIKEELQASTYQEWQREGIRNYTVKSMQKYMTGGADPLFMLGLYVTATLGWDFGKAAYHVYTERKNEQTNPTDRQAG